MKRLITLAILAAFVLGTVATASAIVDVKASGSWRVSATWLSDQDLRDGDVAGGEIGQSEFDIVQRVRTAFQFIANENLRGVWHIEIGGLNWGQSNGLRLGQDQVGVIETKQAYIDFMIPNTEINIMAGALPLALPSGAVGNPVFDDDVAALVLSTPLFDGVGLIGGYARIGTLRQGTGNDANGEYIDTELDAWVLALAMNFDWLSLTPYTMIAYTGDRWLSNITASETAYNTIPAGLVSQNATLNQDGYAADDGDVSVWWGGMAFGLNLDPVMIDGHFVYGNLDGPNNLDRAGWEADIALSYTGFDFMTPRLVFMWSSGEDGNGSDGDDGDGSGDQGESERLPVISPAQASTNFWDGGGIIGDGSGSITGQSDAEQMGYWTLGLEINDVSFLENLTHDFSIYYIAGTNDETIATNDAGAGPYGNGIAYGLTLTDDDDMVEYVVRTEYQMYDQLTFILSLGYLDVDMDEDDNGASGWTELNGAYDDADATKVLLGVRYDF